MNEQQWREVVIRALTEVAPDIDPAAIDPEADLAEQLDIDSMDFLNVIVAIHEQTGIEIPERDYGKLSTLDDAVRLPRHRADARRRRVGEHDRSSGRARDDQGDAPRDPRNCAGGASARRSPLIKTSDRSPRPVVVGRSRPWTGMARSGEGALSAPRTAVLIPD